MSHLFQLSKFLKLISGSEQSSRANGSQMDLAVFSVLHLFAVAFSGGRVHPVHSKRLADAQGIQDRGVHVSTRDRIADACQEVLAVRIGIREGKLSGNQ